MTFLQFCSNLRGIEITLFVFEKFVLEKIINIEKLKKLSYNHVEKSSRGDLLC